MAFVSTKLLSKIMQYQLDHTSHTYCIYFGINSRRLAPSIGWSTTALHVGTPSSVTMRPARRWPPCCPGGEEGKGTGVGRGRTVQNLAPGGFCCARVALVSVRQRQQESNEHGGRVWGPGRTMRRTAHPPPAGRQTRAPPRVPGPPPPSVPPVPPRLGLSVHGIFVQGRCRRGGR